MSTDLLQPTAMELLNVFTELEHRRRELEDDLKKTKADIEAIQEPLTEAFALNGLTNVKKDGLTVFLKHNHYCSKLGGVETETLVAALRLAGCEYMVSEGYNPSSLRARVREWIDDGEEVPEPLQKLLSIGVNTKLASRRA